MLFSLVLNQKEAWLVLEVPSGHISVTHLCQGASAASAWLFITTFCSVWTSGTGTGNGTGRYLIATFLASGCAQQYFIELLLLFFGIQISNGNEVSIWRARNLVIDLGYLGCQGVIACVKLNLIIVTGLLSIINTLREVRNVERAGHIHSPAPAKIASTVAACVGLSRVLCFDGHHAHLGVDLVHGILQSAMPC